jgi:hypothetical protein
VVFHWSWDRTVLSVKRPADGIVTAIAFPSARISGGSSIAYPSARISRGSSIATRSGFAVAENGLDRAAHLRPPSRWSSRAPTATSDHPTALALAASGQATPGPGDRSTERAICEWYRRVRDRSCPDPPAPASWTSMTAEASPFRRRVSWRNDFGFWAVAVAFTMVMGFTTVPAPLWSLYAERDHLSSFTVTIVFAAAALAQLLTARRSTRQLLAGVFLAVYLAVAGPVIGLGALTLTASTRVRLLVFAGLLALGILAAAPALLGRGGTGASSQPQPAST